MREEVSRIHNVVPIESAHGRRRHAGRTRFGQPAQVGDLTARLRRRDAARTVDRATAEERTRGKLRDLAMRETEAWLGAETSVIKGLGVPGRLLSATTCDKLTFVARLRELGSRQEATAIFVTDGTEVCAFEGDYLDVGEVFIGSEDGLDLSLGCLRPASGQELTDLCQDLCQPASR